MPPQIIMIKEIFLHPQQQKVHFRTIYLLKMYSNVKISKQQTQQSVKLQSKPEQALTFFLIEQ